jgi:hypothetical protein
MPPTEHLGQSLPLGPLPVNRLHYLVHDILITHGCSIEHDPNGGSSQYLTYPPRTIRQEILLRTSEVRIKVLLPDGVELREAGNPRGGMDLMIVLPDPPQIHHLTDEEYELLEGEQAMVKKFGEGGE